MTEETHRKITLNGYKLKQSDAFIYGRIFREADEQDGTEKNIHEWDLVISKVCKDFDYDELCRGYAFQDAVIAAR